MATFHDTAGQPLFELAPEPALAVPATVLAAEATVQAFAAAHPGVALPCSHL